MPAPEILGNIHKALVKSSEEALDAYRKASGERHALLRRMMPEWRLVQETLSNVGAHRRQRASIARSASIVTCSSTRTS